MKSRTGLVLLFVAFASILALATAFEPEVVATIPSWQVSRRHSIRLKC